MGLSELLKHNLSHDVLLQELLTDYNLSQRALIVWIDAMFAHSLGENQWKQKIIQNINNKDNLPDWIEKAIAELKRYKLWPW